MIFTPTPYLLNPLTDFHYTSHKCSSPEDGLQDPDSNTRSCDLHLQFRVRLISSEPFQRFSFNFTQMFLSFWQRAESWLSYADSRSRSHLKVMGFTLQLRVRSISPEPFERIPLTLTQIILSVRRCAETMTQLCRLKCQGHTARPWDLPVNLVSTPYLLNPNVSLIETVCRTYNSATQAQGQGHISRSWDLPFNIVSAPYLLNHSNDLL